VISTLAGMRIFAAAPKKWGGSQILGAQLNEQKTTG